MKRELLDALLADRAAKKPVVLATTLGTGAQWLICANGCTPGAPDAIVAAARAALAEDKSQTVESPDGLVFLQVHNPPLRMIVVGAVHIAQALAPMAALAGYQVTVVDPRGAFATEDRFPGVTVSDDWPDEAMEALALDSRTAVVTLTHDPKLDDAALEVALKSDAFYIGSLGSKKTHLARTKRLARLGIETDAIARIHGPAGLPIGSRAPAEIAVAILAQVIETRRRAPAPAAEDRAA
jgi:xanthine dehydrogenase accessory factor